MTTAADRGWGHPGSPGTATATTYRRDHIVTIAVGGIRLHVRREVAPLFAGFITEITKRGYDLSGRADDWAYICRPIRGYEDEWNATRLLRYLSNHSWGLAIDLNAVDHPLGQRGTGVPDWVVDEAHRWGLSWGGDYIGRPDEMHFECLLTPAQVEQLVENLTTHRPPLPTQPEDDLMRDERIVEVDAERPWTFVDEKEKVLGFYTKTSSVQALASNEGKVTPLIVQWFRSDGPSWSDALAVAFANLDGTPAPPGAKARIVIEHRT